VGPIALFDKSFLQSIGVDESVWFDHFFMPMVCPIFYVETLGNLAKETTGRSPEAIVRDIANKFPEWGGLTVRLSRRSRDKQSPRPSYRAGLPNTAVRWSVREIRLD
jgi:hypothetical protein